VIDGLVWTVWILIGVLYETWALHEQGDRFRPLTYWWRWLIYGPRPSGYSWMRPVYWLAAGLWVWVGIHFLIDPLIRGRL
jgi:hypothetical protein